MTEAFAMDLGPHDRRVRRRLDGTPPVGLRAPPPAHRLKAWLRRYETCCRMETARAIAGGDVADTVWAGTTHHHLTYGRTADLPGTVGYLHIDNHTDDYVGPHGRPDGVVRTAGFTDRIREERDVAYIGAYCPDAPSLDRRQTDDWDRSAWTAVLEELPDRIYVSVDMDVFDRSVFRATHSQGFMEMTAFRELADRLDAHHDVVAADIIGLDHGFPSMNLEPYRAVVRELVSLC